jgi:hypothetical protein
MVGHTGVRRMLRRHEEVVPFAVDETAFEPGHDRALKKRWCRGMIVALMAGAHLRL